MLWEYNSIKFPQRKCFENTTPQSYLRRNVLRIQFSKIVSKGIFWEYNSAKLPKRKVWEYNSGKLSQKNAGWECNSVELPQRECCWMQHPQNDLGRSVLMTLTQGHNFDLGFLTQGQIWFLTRGQFFIWMITHD